MRRAFSAGILLLLWAGHVEAQGPLVKYGKWAVVAGSVGMTFRPAVEALFTPFWPKNIDRCGIS